jgi:hypothetical protein
LPDAREVRQVFIAPGQGLNGVEEAGTSDAELGGLRIMAIDA